MHLHGPTRFPVHSPCLAAVLTLAFLGIASCGPSPRAGGGIGGTGSVASVSSGPVTKLGSVFVSGTEYDNANAIYCIDDEPCTRENNLKLGMVVGVQGRVQSSDPNAVTRIADIITFEGTLEGVVQSVAQDGSSLLVLGQFIALDPKTVIDASVPGRSVRNLTPGLDVVEVSGLVAGDGQIVATLIMKRTGKPQYEVQGLIKNHDARAQRFEIGQLIVEYSSADISEIAGSGTTDWNGFLVHVRGGDEWQPRSEVPYGARLTATRVKSFGLTVEDSAEAKIEGVITQLTQPGWFAINNYPIKVSAETQFEEGTASEFTVGVHVFIHGVLVQGVLEAQQVVFKENVEIESNVESIDMQSSTLTLAGLPGLPIAWDARTVTEDEDTPSRFDDIRIGDHMRVHARLIEGQRVVATELERTSPSTSIVFQAPLQLAVDPHILLAATSIDTAGISENEFVGLYGAIGRLAFFDKAVIGRPVRVKGTLAGSIVTWSSVGVTR